MRLLHYILAPVTCLPPFPSSWGTRPQLSREDRDKVPFASASILWSDVGPEFYEKCSIPPYHDFGWKVERKHQSQLCWKVSSTSGSFSNPSPDSDYRVLYPRDYRWLGETLSSCHRDKIARWDTTKNGAMTHDPSSRGTLSFIHQREFFGPQPAWRLGYEEEPVGIVKDDMIVLFTRYNHLISADTLLVSFVHNLHEQNVADLVNILDSFCVGTDINKVMIWDLDLDGEVVRKIERSRHVEKGFRNGPGAHLFAHVVYADYQRGEGRTDGEHSDRDEVKRVDEIEILDRQMWIWL